MTRSVSTADQLAVLQAVMREGSAAYYKGYELSENPYGKLSDKWFAWRRGFINSTERDDEN